MKAMCVNVVIEYFLNYRNNFYLSFNIFRTVFPWPVYYDGLMSLTVIGGTEVTPAFKGYVGEAKIYRNKLYKLSQVF